MRVFELSKELGTTSRYLMTQLQALDIEATSIWTDLDEDDVLNAKIKFEHRPWDDLQAEADAEHEKLHQKAERGAERRAAKCAEELKALEAARAEAERLEALTRAVTEPEPEKEPETAERKTEPETEPDTGQAPTASEEPKAIAETEAAETEAEAPVKSEPKAETEPKPGQPEAAEPEAEPKPAPEDNTQHADTQPAPQKREKPEKTKRAQRGEKSKEAKLLAVRRAQASREAKASEKKQEKAAAETTPATPEQAGDKTITLRGDDVLVKDLADKLRQRANRVIAELMRMNVLAAINQRIDVETATKVAKRFDYKVERSKGRANKEKHQVLTAEDVEDAIPDDAPEAMKGRPPVVTFLGHVDHGKTSLMDRIRDAAVATGEAGGITQHIGAYTVSSNGHRITFLDTPGHAAFSAMRARGANLTDIAVIIIAADDGIMPQTREAIKHAQSANVALMVAINKCDLPAANPDRVRTQLQAEGLTPEEWGGDVICSEVSAQTGEGLDSLLEMIQLQAEVLELQANPDRRANGYVIEAQMEGGRGPTASVLVTGGTLKTGDAMLCGEFYGKIRALMDDRGKQVKSAGPSIPVKAMGLSGVPEAGSEFVILKNEKRARTLAGKAAEEKKLLDLSSSQASSLDALMTQIKEQGQLEMKVIVRADTQGSVEAIEDSLNDIKSEKVALSVIHSGTGNITVTDVQRASAGEAVIIGFHVNSEPGVQAAARHERVRVLTYRIIYELVERVKQEMLNLLQPEYEQVVRGRAELRKVFSYDKKDRVAGCLVTKGTINNKCTVRVIRNKDVVHEGPIRSIRHFQDEVKGVREAQECGVLLADFNQIEEGDILEFYELEEQERKL